MRRQAWKNEFAKGTSDKGLLSKVSKEHLKFISNKTNNIFIFYLFLYFRASLTTYECSQARG